MRVYTAQELGTSRDCLTPGCPLTAEPGTERCRTHEGRTDTVAGLPSPRVNTRESVIADAAARRLA